MYSFGSKVLGAAASKPLLINFGYALISVLMRLTFTFGATFRHEEMLKACPLKCKLAKAARNTSTHTCPSACLGNSILYLNPKLLAFCSGSVP